jgi:hypothetical protein
MGNPIENTFESDPVGDDGVAYFTDIPLVGVQSTAVQITLITDQFYSDEDRTAKLAVAVTGISTEKILSYRGNLFEDGAPLAPANFKKTAYAEGTFRDKWNCVPPINPSPPCEDPYGPFDLVDKNGKPYPLTGNGFKVSGALIPSHFKYPKDAVISGSLVLVCD